MGARTPIALGTNNIETLETPSLIQNVTTVDRMYVINGASVASSYVLKGATVASFYVLFRATVAPTSLSHLYKHLRLLPSSAQIPAPAGLS